MRIIIVVAAALAVCLVTKVEPSSAGVVFNWVQTRSDPDVPSLDMRIELPDEFWFGQEIHQEGNFDDRIFLAEDSKVIEFEHWGGYWSPTLSSQWVPCGDVNGFGLVCGDVDLETRVLHPWALFKWHLARGRGGMIGSLHFTTESTTVDLESLPGSPLWQLNFYGEDGHEVYCYDARCNVQGRWVVDARTIPVPEPMPLLIGGAGLVSLWGSRRRKAN